MIYPDNHVNLCDVAIGVVGNLFALVAWETNHEFWTFFGGVVVSVFTSLYMLARAVQSVQAIWYAYQDRKENKLTRPVPPLDSDYEPN